MVETECISGIHLIDDPYDSDDFEPELEDDFHDERRGNNGIIEVHRPTAPRVLRWDTCKSNVNIKCNCIQVLSYGTPCCRERLDEEEKEEEEEETRRLSQVYHRIS